MFREGRVVLTGRILPFTCKNFAVPLHPKVNLKLQYVYYE